MIDLNKLSFRGKLRSAFLAVTILSILITGVFSYSIAANRMETNAMKLTQDAVVKSAQIADEKLSKLMIVMMTFMISQPFQSMLKDVLFGEKGQYFTHLANLDNVFSQARMAEPLIHSIYVSTPIGEFYPLSMNRNRQASFADTPLFGRVSEQKRNIWVEGHEDNLFLGKARVVSLILEPIADFPLKDVYVVVNIREEGLRKLVAPDTAEVASRFLLDADAGLVATEPDALVRQAVGSGILAPFVHNRDQSTGYSSEELNGDTYLINYARLGINDWTILSIQSKADVLKDMNDVKWLILLLTVCCFIVTVLVSDALTRYLLKPLLGLQRVMKRVEGNDLTARFESRSSDELAQVGNRFNRMLEQIVVLIEEVRQAETNKRSAEIKALSAQMDPHFLYNTLNTIYWKLKLGQVEPSQQMVVALSRLFQIGLNKGNEITTLDKELQHVRQYLELQAFCYESLFEYDIRVREAWLTDLPVPRIMLQPLVENSILHGFGGMESGGRITIEADGDMERQRWYITVKDNGRGMDETTVRSLHRPEPERGYAIGNMFSRLRLYYGDEADVTIESGPDEGTTVRLSLPLKGTNPDVHT
ncbi:sensor histidine kinase [Paenibacillus hemerocallicola]|uniref:Sensor histidine kinase n=1 Tax=Paenibacillus hemerocallicola TaxID=1172614 RepID=A0A5C4SZA4_9BACL|nr:sensor histidine kinase [Paenibacillus hemerocallicola]